ncbi:MAG: O-antigen ligase family protein [Oligoflexales bacterium]
MSGPSNNNIQKSVDSLIALGCLAVVPNIVHLRIYDLKPRLPFLMMNQEGDWFAHYKTIAFAILAIVALGVSFSRFKRFAHLPVALKLLSAGVFGIVVSAFTQEDLSLALWGYPEYLEGAATWLCYLVLALWAYSAYIPARLVWGSLAFTAVVQGILSICQIIDFNIFEWAWVRYLMTGSTLELPMKYVWTGVGQASGTFANPNYLGTFSAMILSMVFSRQITKRVNLKDPWWFVFVLVSVMLIGSYSRTGWLAFGIAVCYVLIIGGIKRILNLQAFVTGTLLFVLVSSVLSFRDEEKDLEILPSKLVDLDIDVDGHSAQVKSRDMQFQLFPTTDGISISVNPGTVFQKNKYRTTIRSLDGVEGSIVPIPNNYAQRAMRITVDRRSFDLGVVANRVGIIAWGAMHNTVEPKRLFPRDWDRMISKRFYIWSRTVPLIIERPWLGYGSGVFRYRFPQTDFDAKLGTLSIYDQIIGRPHSMYLNIAFSSGVFALGLVSAAWLVGFVSSVKSIKLCDDFSRFGDAFTLAASAGLLSYCIAGIANDSHVGIGAIMAILLGFGTVRYRRKSCSEG